MPPVSSLSLQVGQELRRCREEMGLSQRDAADAMTCSQATISRVERGIEDMTLSAVEHRAVALGLEVLVTFRRKAVVR